MDNLGLTGIVSIITAGLTIAIGSVAPAIGEGLALANALRALAQQPDRKSVV